jgi:hypothetical protein
MTVLEKFRRHPDHTAAGTFLRALVQFCQEPTSRIFHAFDLSPILDHHLPKPAAWCGLVAGSDTHGSSEREMSCVTKVMSEAPKCL